MSKMLKEFYNSKEPFEVRIFQVIAFCGMLAALAGCITNTISGLSIIVTLTTLFAGVVVVCLMFYVQKTKRIKLASCI